jgi:hypothetical protein
MIVGNANKNVVYTYGRTHNLYTGKDTVLITGRNQATPDNTSSVFRVRRRRGRRLLAVDESYGTLWYSRVRDETRDRGERE